MNGKAIKGNAIAVEGNAAAGRPQDNALTCCNIEHRGVLLNQLPCRQTVPMANGVARRTTDLAITVCSHLDATVIGNLLGMIPANAASVMTPQGLNAITAYFQPLVLTNRDPLVMPYPFGPVTTNLKGFITRFTCVAALGNVCLT